MEDLDLDDVLIYTGEFGLYQKLLFAGLAPFCLNMVFIYFTQFFITLVPDHWCFVEELKDFHPDLRRNLSIPIMTSGGKTMYHSCKVYDINYTTLLEDPSSMTLGNSTPTTSCRAWEYDLTDIGGYHTIVSEYNWVCDKGWYAPMAQSIFFFGAIVGGLITGWAADRFGRVPVLVVCNVIGAISTLLTSVSFTVWEFFLYRFIAGMSYDNIFVMMYVLVLEYIGPKHRTIVANLSIALFFTLGTVILPWVAYAVKDWRLLNNLTSITMVLSCVAYWVLPESARWLISQGRIDEAICILHKIAKLNTKTIPEDVINKFRKSNMKENIEKSGCASLKDLFKSPNLRKITLAITLYWMLVNMVFDGHARNVSNLPLNVFVGFSVASFTELPADIVIVLTLDRWGRRWLAFGTMIASGLFSLISALVPINNIITVAIFAFIGRFCVNMSMNIGLQYAAELLPTVVRAQGVAAVHIGGYIAAIVSPQIVYLGHTYPQVPLIILGLAAVVGGLTALLLPETLNRDLPQTMLDGENFGKDEKCCFCSCIPENTEAKPLTLQDLHQKPSFIKQRTKTSIRGETFRSSLIKQTKEVIYVKIPE